MSLRSDLLNQFRKPEGRLGRLNLWAMNRRHSKVTDWGLARLAIGRGDKVLDVGCGGGRTVRRLAAIAAEGKIFGIDHSEEAVALSLRMNRREIETGRVEIRHGEVSHLPFPDGLFDVVTAVETHYYWPDLPADMREVLRVLRPGGTLAIVAESYKGGKYDKLLRRLEEAKKTIPYAHLSVDEHRTLFEEAGYSDVHVIEDYDRGWLCATGRKPS